MKRFSTGSVGIEQGSELLFTDFEDDGEMWTGDGPRTRSTHVGFSEKFNAPPNVFVTLEMFDMDNQANQRAETVARNITRSGFDVEFSTWGDTKVARATIAWIAIGEARGNDEYWDV